MPAIVIAIFKHKCKRIIDIIMFNIFTVSGWECHFVGYRQFSIICCYMVVYHNKTDVKWIFEKRYTCDRPITILFIIYGWWW